MQAPSLAVAFKATPPRHGPQHWGAPGTAVLQLNYLLIDLGIDSGLGKKKIFFCGEGKKTGGR